MNEELKATIKDLYQVEKNPETILTVLKDEGHKLTIDQVNDVLGVKKHTPPKNTTKKVGNVFVKTNPPSSKKGLPPPAPQPTRTTDIEQAIQEAADAIEEAQHKVNVIWELKKKAGQEAGRYVRSAHQLRKLKKTIEG